MPQNHRIRRLLDLLDGALSKHKLDQLSGEFDALTQDSAEVLPFFVLHHVCKRLSYALEGGPVTVELFHEITDGIAGQITTILMLLSQAKPVNAELETLVAMLFQNLA